MRTTVTLDPDVEAHVRRVMRQRGLTFEQAINDAIRRGFETRGREPDVATRTFAMGEPTVPLDVARRLAAGLEDGERVRRLAKGS